MLIIYNSNSKYFNSRNSMRTIKSILNVFLNKFFVDVRSKMSRRQNACFQKYNIAQ